VENGGWGALAAAPIARQVMDYYLLGKEPAAPQNVHAAEPTALAPAAHKTAVAASSVSSGGN